MPTYYVGENEEHRVDHPPMFACREHRRMLTLSERFVAELLEVGQDVMPGNLGDLAQSFHPPVADTFRLPEFLLPPKVVLFNPRNLRGRDALPYTLILVDNRFFGVPARYLSPDRFDGCEECRELPPPAFPVRPPSQRLRKPTPQRGTPPPRRPAPAQAGRRPARPGPPPGGRPPSDAGRSSRRFVRPGPGDSNRRSPASDQHRRPPPPERSPSESGRRPAARPPERRGPSR